MSIKIPIAITLISLSATGAPLPALSQTHPEMVVQMGHTGEVEFVSITPDNKFLITQGGDNTKLWNLSTGEEIRAFPGNSGAAVSPDSKHLLTTIGNNAILWDISSGVKLRDFKGHADAVQSVAISPDGRFAVTGSKDQTAKLWNLATGRTIRTFIGFLSSVDSVNISPDSRFLVTKSSDYVQLWGLTSGAEIRTWAFKDRSSFDIKPAAISPNGRFLITGSWSKGVELWDISTGNRVRGFKGNADTTGSFAISPDGKYLATGNEDKTARLWEISSGKEIEDLTVPSSLALRALAFSPDGKYLATGSDDRTAWLWDISAVKAVRGYAGNASSVVSIAVSPNGRYIATGNEDDTAKLWDIAGGKETKVFEGHVGIQSVAISPDGKYLATGGFDKTAELYDLDTGEETHTLKGHTETVWSVAFSPNGEYLATSSIDGTAKLWEIASGKNVRTYDVNAHSKGHQAAAYKAVFSPDAKYLVTANSNRTASVWEISTGKELRTVKGLPDFSGIVAVSPDGNYLLSISTDNRVRLLDFNTEKEIRTLKGLSSNIISCVFSPDGKYVVAGDLEGNIELWNAKTGEEIEKFEGHSGAVRDLRITPDGKRLASGGADGTTRIWDISSGRELCRLISLGDDWVVVTADGYFDGSPDGMRQIRWTVGLRTFPLEAFSEGYYTPGLLTRVMAGEHITGAKSLARGFALPPLVKITSPAAGTVNESDSLDVSVQAADQGGGVDEIRLYQNGKAIENENRGMKSAGRTQTFRVTLVDGDNVFRAVALSKDRIESNPDEIAVSYKGAQKRARMHVLVVGVNEYKNSDLNLNYAQPDAQSIEDFFDAAPNKLFAGTTKKGLFNAQATKPAILAELAALKSAPPQDVVVIYLAGHGETIENTWYFVPYDLVHPEQEDEVKARGLSSDELKDAVRSMGAQKVLLMMDACKSGGALMAFAGRGVEDRKALAMLARAAGVHVIAASSKDQIAAEVSQLGHGVFTYTLLEGLKGGAARNGVVTVRELLAYIDRELPEISQKYRTQAQYPVVDSRGMDFPISAGH